jgi:hypothetical protein
MSERPAIACPLQAELSKAWQDAKQEFLQAAKRMKEHSGKVTEAEYARLQGEVQRKKLAAENAHVFLDLHRAEHGC